MNHSPKISPVSPRNYGIDLLRLVAAFYVIILHTIIQGGVFNATVPYSYQSNICRLLLIFAFCAVNIFGIISGYVGYRDTHKAASFSGYLYLWISVVFYGSVICLIYMFLLPGTVSWREFLSMFFPLSGNLYWYFSAYTLVFFLAPYLNQFVCASSEKTLRKCFFLICFIVVPIEFLSKSFAMSNGYSAMWLLILYLLGAIMKKTGICSQIPVMIAVFAIIVIDIAFFYLNLKIPYPHFFIFDPCFEITDSYITPFYLASAILHVIIFSKFRFPSVIQKMIVFAAPSAFFAYIINVQDCFWTYFMKDRFVSWAASSCTGLFFRIIGFSAFFVLSVVFLDYFRRKLFQLMCVQNWCNKISLYFDKNPVT